jgi:TolB protein
MPLRRSFLALSLSLIAGCASELNRAQPTSEAEVLGDVTQLTSGFARAGEAYFSRDMKWIVFQATPPGEEHYAMHVARLGRDGDGRVAGIEPPVRVSPPGTRNSCGYFSPDGLSLIFASTAGKESFDPATAPAAGYQRQGGTYRWDFPRGMEIFRADNWEGAVTAVRDRATNLAQHPITDNETYDAEGAYSPDGKWIVFTSRRTGDAELFAMRPDGTRTVQLTNTPGYDGGPFFSPDGNRLVYRSDRKGDDLLQILVADLAFDRHGNITGLRRERQLTNDGHLNWAPFWHPDGRHIVYTTSRHGHRNYELYVMRSDGSRKTRVTFTEGFDGLPVFSPDGRYLMWSSRRSADGTTQVFAAPFRLPRGS